MCKEKKMKFGFEEKNMSFDILFLTMLKEILS